MAFCNRPLYLLGKHWTPCPVKPLTYCSLLGRRRFGRNVPLSAGLAGKPPSGNDNTYILTSRNSEVQFTEDKSFPEFVFSKFENFGNKRAIIDSVTGQEYSFPQLQELSYKCASALTKLGFKKGDVFATYCTNIPEFPIIYLAVMSMGGVVTTVSSLATVYEMSIQMKDSNAKCIFTVPLLAQNAKQVAENSGIKDVFVVGDAEGCQPFSSLLDNDGKDFPKDVVINPKEDVAVMPYSSGTTGAPKGVMLTHFNLVVNVEQVHANGYHMQADTDDNLLGLLPFFHIFGLNVVLPISLCYGSTLVTLPRYEETSFLETMQNFKISKAFLTPPLGLFLAKSPLVDNYTFPALDYMVIGAAPLSGDLQTQMVERLQGKSLLTSIKQGYGLTETGPVASLVPLASEKTGVVGDILSGTEAKVIDLETGEALGPNERGEVCIRGPQVMKGYLNKPEATREMITEEGWMHTGDIGYYDEDGFFSIVDRCKELIKYKAYQVAPAELEAILISHANVHDAAVIGVADEACGELPKAFIVASGVTEQEVYSYVKGLVAPYKKLRGGIEFVDAIPKSNTGKILRRLLKEGES